jgi:hypothetical protein
VTGSLSPKLKRLDCEADRSHSSGTEVKIARNDTSTPSSSSRHGAELTTWRTWLLLVLLLHTTLFQNSNV